MPNTQQDCYVLDHNVQHRWLDPILRSMTHRPLTPCVVVSETSRHSEYLVSECIYLKPTMAAHTSTKRQIIPRSLVSCRLKAVTYNSLLSKVHTVQPALYHLHNTDLVKDNKVFSYVWYLV